MCPAVIIHSAIAETIPSSFIRKQSTLGCCGLQDIVKLVEDLDGAGIRFIHFSSDSELKSKVLFCVCSDVPVSLPFCAFQCTFHRIRSFL